MSDTRSGKRFFVEATTQFEALHAWPEQPPTVNQNILDPMRDMPMMFRHQFLQYPHRHVFHVTAKIEEADPDRGIEFIQLKTRLNQICAKWHQSSVIWPYSCEQFAAMIFDILDAQKLAVVRVTVSEDGENAGIVERA